MVIEGRHVGRKNAVGCCRLLPEAKMHGKGALGGKGPFAVTKWMDSRDARSPTAARKNLLASNQKIDAKNKYFFGKGRKVSRLGKKHLSS